VCIAWKPERGVHMPLGNIAGHALPAKRCGAALLIFLAPLILLSVALPLSAEAQPVEDPAGIEEPPDPEELEVPQQVGVEPVRDEEIAERLYAILSATRRFEDLEVLVENSVVFLSGTARLDEHRTWARELALRTTDVAAVVNNIQVREGPLWDFSPGVRTLRNMWRGTIQSLPVIAFALVILALAFLASWGGRRLAERLLARRIETPLLRGVAVKLTGVFILILGIYVVLRVTDLTALAATLLGGTGLIGLIIGIGFRDITENFLASLLISVQKPFAAGDAVRIGEHMGIVQKVTARGTLLMGFDGNYIQLPNSTVYKSVIVNFSANPRTQLDFIIGIGYDNRISHAQEIAMGVLEEHPAVLNDPEAMVLVETLGPATVNLRVFFWLNTREHSPLKVKSAVMRLTVRAFLEAGISMPDSERERIFPAGPPQAPQAGAAALEKTVPPPPPRDTAAPATHAEGDLRSEVEELQQQANDSRLPEEGADILGRGGGVHG